MPAYAPPKFKKVNSSEPDNAPVKKAEALKKQEVLKNEEVPAAGKVKDQYARIVAAVKGDNIVVKAKPALPIIAEEKTDLKKELPVELHFQKKVLHQKAVSVVESSKKDNGLIPRDYKR